MRTLSRSKTGKILLQEILDAPAVPFLPANPIEIQTGGRIDPWRREPINETGQLVFDTIVDSTSVDIDTTVNIPVSENVVQETLEREGLVVHNRKLQSRLLKRLMTLGEVTPENVAALNKTLRDKQIESQVLQSIIKDVLGKQALSKINSGLASTISADPVIPRMDSLPQENPQQGFTLPLPPQAVGDPGSASTVGVPLTTVAAPQVHPMYPVRRYGQKPHRRFHLSDSDVTPSPDPSAPPSTASDTVEPSDSFSATTSDSSFSATTSDSSFGSYVPNL